MYNIIHKEIVSSTYLWVQLVTKKFLITFHICFMCFVCSWAGSPQTTERTYADSCSRFLTCWIPILSPGQQCQSAEGKKHEQIIYRSSLFTHSNATALSFSCSKTIWHHLRTHFLPNFTCIIASPNEGDGRLCFRRRRYVGSWHQFKPDCHQTLSVIPLATGKVIIEVF